MRYAITHATRFQYAFPVRFARCNLRLKPIDWDGQRLEDHRLRIDPAAVEEPGWSNGYPVNVSRIVIDKPSIELLIESHAHVLVDRVTPVPAAGDPSVSAAGRLARDAQDWGGFAPGNYLYPSPLIAAFPEIAAWCALELRPERGVIEAGLALARAIQAGFHYDGSATQLDTW